MTGESSLVEVMWCGGGGGRVGELAWQEGKWLILRGLLH